MSCESGHGRTRYLFIVLVPYVDTVVAVTVMRVWVFVLHVCMPRDGDGVRLMAIMVLGMEVWLW